MMAGDFIPIEWYPQYPCPVHGNGFTFPGFGAVCICPKVTYTTTLSYPSELERIVELEKKVKSLEDKLSSLARILGG